MPFRPSGTPDQPLFVDPEDQTEEDYNHRWRCDMSVEELKAEARAYLARELLASLDAVSEAEIEKLWIDEAIRRDEELDTGAARAYPAHEVLARARARRSGYKPLTIYSPREVATHGKED
jgi:hypothetical protein